MSNDSIENLVNCLVATREKDCATFEFLESFSMRFSVGGRLTIASSASRFASIRIVLGIF